MDYYGRKLATCSSDRSVRIFEVNGNTQTHVATLQGWAQYICVCEHVIRYDFQEIASLKTLCYVVDA